MGKLSKRFWNWLLLGLGIHDIRQKQRNINERLRLIEKLVDVGVDIHTQSDSWVVLCLAGKPEYVEFSVCQKVQYANYNINYGV